MKRNKKHMLCKEDIQELLGINITSNRKDKIVGAMGIYMIALLGFALMLANGAKKTVTFSYIIMFIFLIFWNAINIAFPLRNCINQILYTAFESVFNFILYMTVYFIFVYEKMKLTSPFLMIIPCGIFATLLTSLIIYRRSYYLGKKKVAFNKKPALGIVTIGIISFGTLIKMLLSGIGSNTKDAIVALATLPIAFVFGINMESFYRYIWARRYKEYFISDISNKKQE